MANIPPDRSGLLAFAQGHYQTWIERYSALGLSQNQAASVQEAAEAVTAATIAANEARAASQAATSVLAKSYRDLRSTVAAAVRTINDFALASDNPQSVYDKAMLQAPQPRGQTPPPTPPFDLGIALNPTTGGLILRWKAVQPEGVHGVVYRVMRAIGISGEFQQIGLVGEKNMTDASIPAGTSHVAYTIISQRGGQTSLPSAAIDVRFGIGQRGQVVVTNISKAA